MRLIGLRFSDEQTPEERRQQTVTSLPRAERPVTAITRLYIDERYGPTARRPEDEQRYRDIAEDAWPDARGNILSRWLRRLLPWRRE